MISSNVTGASAYSLVQQAAAPLGGGDDAAAAEFSPSFAAPSLASPTASFGAALQGALSGLVASGRAADAKAVDAMSGKGNLTDVVMAVSKAEMALQATVAVRDKVIAAYQDIMKMSV